MATLEWHGIYCEQRPGGPSPEAVATAFTVSFYADATAFPVVDDPLLTETFSPEEADQTFTDSIPVLECGAGTTTWEFYQYRVALASPFVAEPGETYWISIHAVTPDYTVFWGWLGSTADNRHSIQLFAGETTEFEWDRSFVLSR